MIPETALGEATLSDPVTILAPLVAVLATAFLIYAPQHLGNDARLWRAVRSLLPHVDEEARENGFYTDYSPDPELESAGWWTGSLDDLDSTLLSLGFRVGPLAAHKTLPDGRREQGSWVYFGRDISSWPRVARFLFLLIAPYQLHVTIFPSIDGERYLVTAHYEWSAYSPLWAFWHLKKRYYDEAEGVYRTTMRFAEAGVQDFEPTSRAEQLVADRGT